MSCHWKELNSITSILHGLAVTLLLASVTNSHRQAGPVLWKSDTTEAIQLGCLVDAFYQEAPLLRILREDSHLKVIWTKKFSSSDD